MAALSFFRKNKKLVFWIMVVLMVFFLLGISGQQVFVKMCAPDPEQQVLGVVDGREVTTAQLRVATGDLQMLQEVLGLGDSLRILTGYPRTVPGEKGFALLLNRSSQAGLCWLLLVHEARAMGIEAGEARVNAFLGEYIGIDPESLPVLIAKRATGNVLVRDLRRALDDYLCVAHAFDAVSGGLDEGEPAIRELFADMANRMDVAMLQFKAGDYVNQAKAPSEEQVLTLYNEAKRFFAAAPGNPHPFKFGYRLPDRVQIEYVFVNWDDVSDTVEPDGDEIYRYWQEHKDEFTEQVVVSPATQPASQAATQPTTQPESQPAVEYVTVPIADYAKVKSKVRQELRRQGTQKRIEQITEQLLGLVRQFELEGDGSAGEGPLKLAADEMAKESVAVHYKRFGELIDGRQVLADPILGSARVGGTQEQDLATLAFSVKQLHADERRQQALVEVGKVYGRAMDVGSELSEGPRGKLFWRVVAAEPTAVPETVQTVRSQVEADCKIQVGYKIAMDKANEAMDQLRQVGMAETAKALGKEVIEAGELTRRQIAPIWRVDARLSRVYMSAMQIEQWLTSDRQEPAPQVLPGLAYLAAAMSPQYVMVMPPVPEVDQAETAEFLKAVFVLAPPEKPSTRPDSQPTSAVSEADKFAVVALPGQQSVFVVQRVKYTPANDDEYRKMRPQLLQVFKVNKRLDLTLRWYVEDEIKKRTGFFQSVR